jgi:signal transduction histidine kinase
VMRVLANLVGNAIKFSPKHSRVNVKVKADAQFANISILDSAPQIPESRMASLFDNFWQARRSAVQGAGVGLTVVKTIIEAHGGIVKVEHNLQGGNTFTFSLPRRRPANAQLKKPQSSGVRKIARAADPFETAPPQAPTH